MLAYENAAGMTMFLRELNAQQFTHIKDSYDGAVIPCWELGLNVLGWVRATDQQFLDAATQQAALACIAVGKQNALRECVRPMLRAQPKYSELWNAFACTLATPELHTLRDGSACKGSF